MLFAILIGVLGSASLLMAAFWGVIRAPYVQANYVSYVGDPCAGQLEESAYCACMTDGVADQFAAIQSRFAMLGAVLQARSVDLHDAVAQGYNDAHASCRGS